MMELITTATVVTHIRWRWLCHWDYAELSTLTVGDCNDEDASIYVGADDTWYDGIDSTGDGANDYDQDGDGVVFYRECDDTDELKRQNDESLSIIETQMKIV